MLRGGSFVRYKKGQDEEVGKGGNCSTGGPRKGVVRNDMRKTNNRDYFGRSIWIFYLEGGEQANPS